MLPGPMGVPGPAGVGGGALRPRSQLFQLRGSFPSPRCSVQRHGSRCSPWTPFPHGCLLALPPSAQLTEPGRGAGPASPRGPRPSEPPQTAAWIRGPMGAASLNGFILPENTQFPFALGAKLPLPGLMSREPPLRGLAQRHAAPRAVVSSVGPCTPPPPGVLGAGMREPWASRGAPGLLPGCSRADQCGGQAWVAAGADQHGSLAARKGRRGHPSWAITVLVQLLRGRVCGGSGPSLSCSGHMNRSDWTPSPSHCPCIPAARYPWHR